MRQRLLAVILVLTAVLGVIGGTGLLTQADAEQAVVAADGGWRYGDGYWNYYDPTDKAYYYTDGRHWYSYGDDKWSVYNFDKSFGKAYVREGYTVPKAGPDLVLPSHKIKVKVK